VIKIEIREEYAIKLYGRSYHKLNTLEMAEIEDTIEQQNIFMGWF
jgi:hypothetical protein